MLWQWLWFPYGALMAHRGLSHVYVLGTITRVLYLFFFVVPAAIMLFNMLSPYLGQACGYPIAQIRLGYSQVPPLFWWGLVVAWSIQDAGHIFTDHHHRQAGRLIRRLRSLHASAWVPVVVIALLILLFFR